jgi:hypothetical protein
MTIDEKEHVRERVILNKNTAYKADACQRGDTLAIYKIIRDIKQDNPVRGKELEKWFDKFRKDTAYAEGCLRSAISDLELIIEDPVD